MTTARDQAREAYEAVERSVRATDRVIADAGRNVMDVFESVAQGDQPLTEAQRVAIMRRVDRVAVRTFMPRGGRIEASPVYRVIRNESERVFIQQYRHALDELDKAMAGVEWWPRLKAELIAEVTNG